MDNPLGLDGDLTAVENGVEFPITSATFNWSYYVYERANGTPIDSRDAVTYSPHFQFFC
jgi:hypothetical protein